MKSIKPLFLNAPTHAQFHGLQGTVDDPDRRSLLLLVSIKNSEQCQGVYLKCSIQSALALKFHVSMLLGDELYKYNLATDDQTPEEKSQEALQLGRDFMTQQLPYILEALQLSHLKPMMTESIPPSEWVHFINEKAEEAGIAFKIYTWSDWAHMHEPFIHQHQATLQALMNHPELKEAIHQFEINYLQRFTSRLEMTSDKVRHYRTQYVAEECLYILSGAINEHCNYIAYPSQALSPFLVALNLIRTESQFHDLALELLESKLTYLTIKFSGRSSHQRSWSQQSYGSDSTSRSEHLMDELSLTSPTNFSQPSTPRVTPRVTPRPDRTQPDANPVNSLFFLSHSDSCATHEAKQPPLIKPLPRSLGFLKN